MEETGFLIKHDEAGSSHKESQLKGVKTRLYSRHGFYLDIDRENGGVKGVDDDSESTIFYLIPVGLRIVSIQHSETLLYIAMNSEGRLYTTDVYTMECKFKESVHDNYYVVYTSCIYKQLQSGRPWNVGMSKDGIPVKGSHAKKHKPCTHFIPRPIEVRMFKEPTICELAAPSRSVSSSDNKKRKNL
uniref:fibroblast growth factor 11/12/13/14 isoform X2 n=1 Tax=Ciona intestinalis TaxID=7719 RepID=UPI000EF51E35|nr:fibroblast growth factor 11/12/13/14 isoform X2 [Ciona intestinalis]|eukprot:XP_026694546.1 fibroblast growth factor 11/12/13/14 isoform X2 [Ciona intestinalis]